MKKYNWNIDTLLNKCNELRRRYNKETDENIKRIYLSDIMTLQEYIRNNSYNKYTKDDKLLKIYNEEKKHLKEYMFLWGFFKEFNSINKNIVLPDKDYKTISLDEKDILDLTHDFYKSLNSFLFGNFMKNYYQRRNHIYFRSFEEKDTIDGETLFIASTNESYINVFRSYTIDDLLTTIHEYGHALTYCANIYNLFNPNDYYAEIIPIFLELIASDYIGKNIDNSYSSLIKENRQNLYHIFNDIINSKLKLIESETLLDKGYQTNKDLKFIGRTFCNIDKDNINILFNKDNTYLDECVIAYIIAIELYELYQIDKDKCLDIVKKIILLEGKSNKTYFDEIKRLGINPNQNSYEYIRKLIK